MLIILEKKFMLLHNFRTYFLPPTQLQPSFSNLLTRANNQGPHFISSIFYEVFGGTGLIHPEMSRKLAIFVIKKSKNFLKTSFFAPETFFFSNFNIGDNFYINKGLL